MAHKNEDNALTDALLLLINEDGFKPGAVRPTEESDFSPEGTPQDSVPEVIASPLTLVERIESGLAPEKNQQSNTTMLAIEHTPDIFSQFPEITSCSTVSSQANIPRNNMGHPDGTTSVNPGLLYVGDLADNVTEPMLQEKFGPMGVITSIRVCRDSVTKRSLNYAYVNFQNNEDAKRAIKELNYEQISGRSCRVSFSNRDPSAGRNGGANIFVKKLHEDVDTKTLHDTFLQFGEITSCKVSVNGEGKSNGFGFVNFKFEQSAKEAIEKVNGCNIAGVKVSVAPFIQKKDRQSSIATATTFTNVYSRNFSFTKLEAEEFFAKFGAVTSLYYAMNKNSAYVCVNYANNEAANKCIKEVHDTEINGQKLMCVRAIKKAERQAQARRQREMHHREMDKNQLNLYIKNLDDNIDDAKLKETFSVHGNVKSAKVMLDDKSRLSRGFGFVSFEKPEEAAKAMAEMNNKIISIKPLYVAVAQRKQDRMYAMQAARSRNMVGIMPPIHNFPNMPPYMFQQPQYGRPYNDNRQTGFNMSQMSQYQQPRTHFNNNSNYPPYNQRPYNNHQKYNNGVPVGRQGQQGGGQVRQQSQNQGGYFSNSQEPLTASALAAASDPQRKQVLGERLFPKISRLYPNEAPKITGMLLEMDNSELLHLLEDEAALREKTNEAFNVLREHEKQNNKQS